MTEQVNVPELVGELMAKVEVIKAARLQEREALTEAHAIQKLLADAHVNLSLPELELRAVGTVAQNITPMVSDHVVSPEEEEGGVEITSGLMPEGVEEEGPAMTEAQVVQERRKRGVEVDSRPADQIAKDSFVSPDPNEVANFESNLGNQFARAVQAGMNAAERIIEEGN